MRYLRTYEIFKPITPNKDFLRYHYIRYKNTSSDGRCDLILKIDSFDMVDGNFKCRILDLSTDTYRNIFLSNRDFKEYSNENDTIWRDATEEEIEQFDITDSAKKYNI